jgi:hypothetical protein
MRTLVAVVAGMLIACSGGPAAAPVDPADVPRTPVSPTWTISGDSITCPGADYAGPNEAQYLCEWTCAIYDGPSHAIVRAFFCRYDTGWDVCMFGAVVLGDGSDPCDSPASRWISG